MYDNMFFKVAPNKNVFFSSCSGRTGNKNDLFIKYNNLKCRRASEGLKRKPFIFRSVPRSSGPNLIVLTLMAN